MRRLLAVVLLAALLGCAYAEETASLQEEPELQPIVNALFAAATGTAEESEVQLRKELTEEEILARNAQNALYRAQTLPWLLAALTPIEAEAEEETLPAPTPEPTPEPTAEPTPEPSPDPDAPPVYSIGDSYAAFLANELGRAYLDLLARLGAEDMESCLQLSREACSAWMAEVDHASLEGMNPDYACWLFAPDTKMDYPIVHCEDNQRYLRRMFNGAQNSSGTLFMDYRNLPDFQDPNTLVYGHHMRNESMFGSLTRYITQAYYEAHPYALVTAEGAVYLLEIFAGYTTSDGDPCYDIAISDEQDMLDFLAAVRRRSDFTSEVQVMEYDRLVTLSTCAYSFRNARYIVIGRLIPILVPLPVSLESEQSGEAPPAQDVQEYAG